MILNVILAVIAITLLGGFSAAVCMLINYDYSRVTPLIYMFSDGLDGFGEMCAIILDDFIFALRRYVKFWRDRFNLPGKIVLTPIMLVYVPIQTVCYTINILIDMVWFTLLSLIVVWIPHIIKSLFVTKEEWE